MSPKNLDGDRSQNMVIKFRLEFEELCIALMVAGVENPRQMSVFSFYTAIKHFESKNKTKPKK